MPCSDCGEVISYSEWGLSGFPNSFQANAFGSAMIRLQSLHLKSFWIYYSFIILQLDAVSGCASPGHHVCRVTEFCRVVPNIWRFWVWILLDVILLCDVVLLTGSWNNTCRVCILQDDGYGTLQGSHVTSHVGTYILQWKFHCAHPLDLIDSITAHKAQVMYYYETLCSADYRWVHGVR